LKVTNEGPEIIDTPEESDWFRVIQAGDSVEFTKWFSIKDDEDYTYAREPYSFIDPDFDENIDQWTISIYDDNTSILVWQTGDSEPFDTNLSGIYSVELEYTDLHGLSVANDVTLWIVPESYVDVDMTNLDMETNGYFPTFMGIFAEFWQPYQYVGPISVEPANGLLENRYENGDIIQYVMALIDGEEVARVYVNSYIGRRVQLGIVDDMLPPPMVLENYGELIQLSSNGTVEITYHAVQEIYDDGEWFKVVSNPIQVEDTLRPQNAIEEPNNKRTIEVTNADFGDYFLSSDIGGTMSYQKMPTVYRGSVFMGEQYPLLIKNKVVTIEDEDLREAAAVMVNQDVLESRIVTTIAEVFEPQSTDLKFSDIGMTSDGMVFKTFSLLDIAETFEDDVFGISLEEKWVESQVNPSDDNGTEFERQMIQKLWKLDDTGAFTEIINIGNVLDSFGLIDEIKGQFGADPEEVSVNMMPIVSLTADKDGNIVFVVSVNVSAPDYFNDFYNVIVVANQDGMVLSMDVTATKQGYPLVSDLAYDETMEHLYAVVSQNPNAFVGNTSTVSTAGLMGPQELIEFIMVEPEEEEGIVTEEVLDNINIGTYYTETLLLLDQNYHYSGIAALNNELVLIKIGEGQTVDRASEVNQADYGYGISTFAEFINLDEESDPVSLVLPEPFTLGLGAAANYDREISLVASPTSVTAGATVNLTFTGKPESVYGEGVWSHNGLGTLSAIDVTAYGVETATYQTVAGPAGTSKIVTFTVDTDQGPVTTSVTVTTPAPTPPTPIPTPPTPAQTVAVTLDIDAITLDYGETADPEFASYDFTETVTGTTDTRVTWELDDDTFVTVDENGVVQAREDVPANTGDITVELTVRTVVGNATDTATIIFEEQTPLGAIEFFDPYVVGYPDGSFKPQNNVTRAEVAAMFSRFLRLNVDYPGTQKFVDVSPSHWAYPQIQAMYRTGIFKGYVNDQGQRMFEPNAAIRRGEIAQVFTNYWDYLDISVTGESVTSIPDVTPSHWAFSAINRVYNTGIFSGFSDGSFKPEDPTLREQLVSMINVMLNRPKNEPAASKFNDIQPNHPYFGDIEAASQTFLNPQGE
jgi:hypothetical protein